MNRNLDLLLDTHVVLQLGRGDTRGLALVLECLDDPTCTVTVSAITHLEIGIKHALGKLVESPALVREQTLASGFSELSFVGGHAEQVAILPLHHRDPFDRALIAQAMAEDMTLVSRDRAFAKYEGLSILAG